MASNNTDTHNVGEAIISCSSLEDVNACEECGESQVIEESANLDGSTKPVVDQNHRAVKLAECTGVAENPLVRQHHIDATDELPIKNVWNL